MNHSQSLKEVIVDLSLANISALEPHCERYVQPLFEGWENWTHFHEVPKPDRKWRWAKRDLDLLGAIEAWVIALSSINEKVTANK